MQRIETVIKTKIKTKGGGRANNPNQMVINQTTGNQNLVEFNDIKNRVQEKMKEYNLFDRAKNQNTKEEEKKSDIQYNSA